MTELERLVELVGLKAVDRAGWLRVGIDRPESVAAHSWGIALLVLLVLPTDLDRERALTYAILHDLAEVRTGDITPHDGVAKADKAHQESVAMHALLADHPRGPALLAAWHDYEAQIDPESRFVRQLDRLDMAIQAIRYQRDQGVDTTEFLDSARRVVTDPALLTLLNGV
ncbi:MAG: HD domain-containing protein [Myxococcota bacterium]